MGKRDFLHSKFIELLPPYIDLSLYTTVQCTRHPSNIQESIKNSKQTKVFFLSLSHSLLHFVIHLTALWKRCIPVYIFFLDKYKSDEENSQGKLLLALKIAHIFASHHSHCLNQNRQIIPEQQVCDEGIHFIWILVSYLCNDRVLGAAN